jgi:hypothetical protein
MPVRDTVTVALLSLLLTNLVHADTKPAARKLQPPDSCFESMSLQTKAVFYKKSILVVGTRHGVAVISFDKSIPNGITYRYRFLPEGQAKEQAGEGRVFEKYKTTLNLLVFRIEEDDGGKRSIEAGPISVRWSHRGRESGWIYGDELTIIRLLAVDENDFTKVDLKKFRNLTDVPRPTGGRDRVPLPAPNRSPSRGPSPGGE